MRERVNEYLSELGIQKSSDVSNIDSFEVIEGEGSDFECIEPAVIEILEDGSIRTHQLGKARRIPGPTDLEPTTTESEMNGSLIRNTYPEAPGGKKYIIRVLLAILILAIGIRLGSTLFDDSDGPKKIPTTTSTSTTTPATTIPPATTTTTN